LFPLFATGVIDTGGKFATGITNTKETGGKWKKSSIRKMLIILFGHLWVVEETYI
jgi:hypothetical protein